jgi:hypothetical protein
VLPNECLQNDELSVDSRVDTKWRYKFFTKYDYRFMLDVIIAIIANFFAKADRRGTEGRREGQRAVEGTEGRRGNRRP